MSTRTLEEFMKETFSEEFIKEADKEYNKTKIEAYREKYRTAILESLKEGTKSASQMIKEMKCKLDTRKAFMRALRSLETEKKIWRTEPDPNHNYVVWWSLWDKNKKG